MRARSAGCVSFPFRSLQMRPSMQARNAEESTSSSPAVTRSMLPNSASKSPPALHKLYPEKYELGSIDTLLLNQSVLQALKQGEDPRRIADDGRQALDHFMQLRAKYLLY